MQQGGGGFQQQRAIRHAQKRDYIVIGDFRSTVGEHLIQRGKRVPHTTVRLPGDEAQCGGRDADLFMLRDRRQLFDNLCQRYAAEIEALAAGQDGNRNLLNFGGREDEFDVWRRLFQHFQQSVEGVFGEHVHFVNNKDLVAGTCGKVADIFLQFADVFHAGIGRAVDFDDVSGDAIGDFFTGCALVAGIGKRRTGLFAIENFGQNACRRGFAHASRSAEQVGVMDAMIANGVFQRIGDMLLADQFGKSLRTPLTG